MICYLEVLLISTGQPKTWTTLPPPRIVVNNARTGRFGKKPAGEDAGKGKDLGGDQPIKDSNRLVSVLVSTCGDPG